MEQENQELILCLLLRLIKQDSGYIVVDGKRLTPDLDAAFQKNINYAQQDVFIKDGTLKENIAFGEKVANIDLL